MSRKSKTELKRKLFEVLTCFLQGGYGHIDTPEDFKAVFDLARIHSLLPILYHVLREDRQIWKDRLPGEMDYLQKTYKTSLYQAVVQELAIKELQDVFFEAGIKLIFFKGAQIRSFYPIPQLRTMGDIDCLIAIKDRERAVQCLSNLGYQCKMNTGDVWVYVRGCVVLELHTRIAGNNMLNGFDYREYFYDALNHTEQQGKIWYFEKEYHFCFLIYHIAKHLRSTGAGIRMIMDIAIFTQYYQHELNWKQIKDMLKEIQLFSVAGAVFQLCERWFGVEIYWEEKISEDTLNVLEEYMLAGGTFGHVTHDCGDVYRRNHYQYEEDKQRKATWLMFKNYIFPSAERMVQIFPAVEHYKWLLPLAWAKRWFQGIFKRREHSIKTIQSMTKADGGQAKREAEMLRNIGL